MPGTQQLVALGELQQLERGARAVAQPGRLLHPVVVDVLVHPRLDEPVLLRGLQRHVVRGTGQEERRQGAG